MPSTISQRQAIELAREDLAVYSALVWPKFELPAHLKLLVQELERVERGECDRLMIFEPPRHGKSLLTSQLFPAWYLGRRPSSSIIATSYGGELAADFGRAVRGFVADPLQRAIFPQCILSEDSAAVHRLGTTRGGAYFAVGAGGPITGRGADLLLIDDPIKGFEQAFSVTERRSLQRWYESTAYTRLQPGGAVILIQTRWHNDDLAAWLLREHADENWRVISLAALAEPSDLLGRREGEALWPARFPADVLERIRSAVGTQAWTAQYLQRPVPEEGSVFKYEWFLTFPAREPPECPQILLSLDTAFKASEAADYSVIQAWGKLKNGFALLAQWRERAEFGALLKGAVAMAERFSPNYVLIEDAASGQSLVQTLKSSTRLPILPVKPLGDKVARAHACAPMVESGRVFTPDQAGWRRDFLDEVCSFPSAPHDDMVDAMSQALNYLREHDYPAYTYSGLLRGYSHDPWARPASERGPWGNCEALDREEDSLPSPSAFVSGGSVQMRGLSATEIRAGSRWASLARRKAW